MNSHSIMWRWKVARKGIEKAMNKRKISAEELQQAIRKFLEKGGNIQKLPEEKAAAGRMVGAKWNAAELGG